jgi:hypothetical protein
LISILCAQLVLVIVAALWTTLGWDGLFNFELKARLAFEQSPYGQIPAAYLADRALAWSHPRYPPLVPFAEFWIYGWLGRVDQSAVKIIFPVFYVSLIALVCGAIRRVANLRAAVSAAIALGCLPPLTLLQGATSGYADVPLAASVAGAACFTYYALRMGDVRLVPVAAALSAAAVWTKAEGAMIAGAIGVAAFAAAGATKWRVLLPLAWVPAVALASWLAVLQMAGTPAATDFDALTVERMASSAGMLKAVAWLMVRELFRPGHWGLVWPCFFASIAIMMATRRAVPADWFLVAAVLIALHVYALAYLFSAWPDVREHVGYSLTRVLAPLAPLAAVVVVRRIADDLALDEGGRA